MAVAKGEAVRMRAQLFLHDLIRLGAILNMDAVSAFFERIERPTDSNRFVDEIMALKYTADGKAVRLELSNYGTVEIRSRKVTIL